VAPVMPFLAERLWQVLVAEPCEDAPDSVFLAGWPEAREVDRELLNEMDSARRIVELGRRARGEAGVKLRQPLRELVVDGPAISDELAREVARELRVRHVVFRNVQNVYITRLKPNLPSLGRRGFGNAIPAISAALARSEYENLPNGNLLVAGAEIEHSDVISEFEPEPGWTVARDPEVTVALPLELDPELELEGRVLDLIHRLNTMRKEAGLELSDRISVTLPTSQSDLLEQHADWVKDEVLAVSIEAAGGSAEPQIAKA